MTAPQRIGASCERTRRSTDELQAPEVVLRPMGFLLDHAFERLGREGVGGLMKRHRHAPAVRMLKAPMTALALEARAGIEAVADESGNNFAGGQAVEMGLFDAHRLRRLWPRVRRKTPLLRLSVLRESECHPPAARQ